MLSLALVLAASALSVEVVFRLVAWRRSRRPFSAFSLGSWGLPLFFAFAATVALSMLEAAFVHDSVTTARIALGCGLWAVGWALRYPLAVSPPRILRRLTPVVIGWNYLPRLSVRHQRYVGLLLEAGGIAALLSAVAGAAIVLLGLPGYVAWAIWRQETRMREADPVDLSFWQRELPRLVPNVKETLALFSVPAATYLIVGVVTREVRISEPSLDVAQDVLLGLAGAQGTLAILGLTAWFVTIQLVSTTYSAQLTPRFWTPAVVLAAAVLFLSIGFDLVVVTRNETMLVGHQERTSVLVDLGLIFAACSMATALAATLAAIRSARPEQVVSHVLRRIDHDWVKVVRRQYSVENRFARVRYTDDPMRAVENLLRSFVLRRDVASFSIALSMLTDKLRDAFREPGDQIVIDEYLHDHLDALIAQSGRAQEGRFLLDMLHMTKEIALAPMGQVAKGEPSRFERPESENLLRTICKAACAGGFGDVASQGIREIAQRGASRMPLLPPQDEMSSMYNRDHEYAATAEKENRQRWRNDQFVDIVEEQYLSELVKFATEGLNQEMDQVVSSASRGIVDIMRAAIELRESPNVRRSLMYNALWHLDDLVKAACVARSGEGIYLGRMQYAFEAIDAGDADREQIIDAICASYARSLERLARAGILDFMNVVDAAMTGLAAGQASKGALNIVEGMGKAAAALEPFQPDEDIRFVARELRSRIEQVGFQTSPAAKEVATWLLGGLPSANDNP